MSLPHTTAIFDKVGRLAVVTLGFSIPISVAADNILLAVVAVCFVARANRAETLAAIRANPVLIASLALFGMLAAGAFYGAAPPDEASRFVRRYLDLLFIPAVAAFFHEPAARRRGLYAFAAAIAVTVVLSSGLYTGLVPRGPWLIYNTEYPVVFKHNLTHTTLMAFGAFLFMQLGAAAETKPLRLLWYVLATAAILNMILLVPGRTGFVILGVLVVYQGHAWWRWKGLAVMLAVSALGFALAYSGSLLFQRHVNRAVQEYFSWNPGAAAADSDAVGLRMEFYRNSLAIVRDHPLAGVGTGGFPQAYAERARGAGMVLTNNPHNEYLLIAVQTGALGLLLLLNLFWQQWRLAPRLAAPLETHVARGLVLAIATGCLFNSLLLDHTEGALFAWFTALLYAGLQSKRARRGAEQGPQKLGM